MKFYLVFYRKLETAKLADRGEKQNVSVFLTKLLVRTHPFRIALPVETQGLLSAVLLRLPLTVNSF